MTYPAQQYLYHIAYCSVMGKYCRKVASTVAAGIGLPTSVAARFECTCISFGGVGLMLSNRDKEDIGEWFEGSDLLRAAAVAASSHLLAILMGAGRPA